MRLTKEKTLDEFDQDIPDFKPIKLMDPKKLGAYLYLLEHSDDPELQKAGKDLKNLFKEFAKILLALGDKND